MFIDMLSHPEYPKYNYESIRSGKFIAPSARKNHMKDRLLVAPFSEA